MYRSYYSLTFKPFELLPDPRFIYFSASYKKALTYLDYGIRERSGFILLTGEVGSGKTTLIRDLLSKHYEHVILSKIFNTCVTSEQLLAMINDDFGLPTQGKDKITLIRDLNAFLVEQYSHGNQPILIIDEAQNLDAPLLEEVRMLSNLETADSKLLQIILVGQPEMRKTLAAPGLRQLRQRININCHLKALSREEVEEYVLHRLSVAGNPTAVIFSPDSLEVIYRYSRGIPRLINIICDFLMLSAFADETNAISIEMVREVIGDLDFDNYYWAVDATVTEQRDVPAVATPAAVSPEMVPYPGTISESAEQQAQNLELQNILAEFARRIESLESSNAVPIEPALKYLHDNFEVLRTTVANRVAKSDTQVLELKTKLERVMAALELAKASEASEAQRLSEIPPPPEELKPSEAPQVGFVRRLFSGATFPR
ncbi:MAG TPA: AAA family ATPase [Desulfuromonadales bacterium]|nr:AAA family ATPase [Desulfuromonadales bacterium]